MAILAIASEYVHIISVDADSTPAATKKVIDLKTKLRDPQREEGLAPLQGFTRHWPPDGIIRVIVISGIVNER